MGKGGPPADGKAGREATAGAVAGAIMAAAGAAGDAAVTNLFYRYRIRPQAVR